MPSFFPVGTYPGIITRTSGLSHYMRLGETTGNLTGDDGDSLTGTMVNVSGNHGSAIAGDSNSSKYFNGSNGYITFGNNVQLVGNFSMEIWVYPTQSRVSTFLSKENYNAPWSGWTWWFDTGMIPCFTRIHGTSSRETAKGVAVALNTWTHLVVTYNGSMLRQYQNGVLRWEQPSSIGMYTSSYPCVMGCMSDYNPVAYADWYLGYLDEWSTYTTALTQAQITERYNRALTPPTLLVSVSDSRKISSTETRNPIAAVLTSRTDSGIIRSTEEVDLDISISRTDAGTISATESFDAIAEFAGERLFWTDGQKITGTEVRSLSSTLTSPDEGTFRSLDVFTIFATRTSTDSRVISSTNTAVVQPMHNVALSFPSVVLRQRGFMHIAAQRLFNGEIHIQYKHSDLVNKGTPTVSHFLVRNNGGLPIALGKMTTTWETGLIVIEMYREMDDHPDLLEQFGIFKSARG